MNIYSHEKRYIRAIEQIKESKIAEENKKHIKGYFDTYADQ